MTSRKNLVREISRSLVKTVRHTIVFIHKTRVLADFNVGVKVQVIVTHQDAIIEVGLALLHTTSNLVVDI